MSSKLINYSVNEKWGSIRFLTNDAISTLASTQNKMTSPVDSLFTHDFVCSSVLRISLLVIKVLRSTGNSRLHFRSSGGTLARIWRHQFIFFQLRFCIGCPWKQSGIKSKGLGNFESLIQLGKIWILKKPFLGWWQRVIWRMFCDNSAKSFSSSASRGTNNNYVWYSYGLHGHPTCQALSHWRDVYWSWHSGYLFKSNQLFEVSLELVNGCTLRDASTGDRSRYNGAACGWLRRIT